MQLEFDSILTTTKKTLVILINCNRLLYYSALLHKLLVFIFQCQLKYFNISSIFSSFNQINNSNYIVVIVGFNRMVNIQQQHHS